MDCLEQCNKSCSVGIKGNFRQRFVSCVKHYLWIHNLKNVMQSQFQNHTSANCNLFVIITAHALHPNWKPHFGKYNQSPMDSKTSTEIRDNNIRIRIAQDREWNFTRLTNPPSWRECWWQCATIWNFEAHEQQGALIWATQDCFLSSPHPPATIPVLLLLGKDETRYGLVRHSVWMEYANVILCCLSQWL